MSKYIIELEDDIKYLIINGRADNRCYTLVRPVAELEVLNSDYINEHFSELQDTAYKKGLHDGESKCRYCNEYQRGLDDAWEAARKVVHCKLWGDYTKDTGKPSVCAVDVLEHYTAAEAIAKLKAYEEQKADDEIKVGDEVMVYGYRGVVTNVHDNLYTVMMRDGSCGNKWRKNYLKKTGKQHDIDKILEEMRE